MKEALSLSVLDAIVKSELRTSMDDASAKSTIRNLFVSYYSLLQRYSIAWALKDNRKDAVNHDRSAIRPMTLKKRLGDELVFSQHARTKDISGFMKHTMKIAETFQHVDNGNLQHGKD